MVDPSQDQAPFEFSAPLSVCMDVTHPLAYLALGPVQALAAQLGVSVDWLPFAAPGLKPPPALDAAAARQRGVRHRQARAAYQASEIRRYAEAQGIHIGDPFRSADSEAACVGHLWLRQQAPDRVADYLRRLFEAHWSAKSDVADRAVVADAVNAVVDDATAFPAFAAGPGSQQLARMRHSLVAAGVFTVPSLIVDGEVFVGRAHLPMVRWLLEGRQGPAPV